MKNIRHFEILPEYKDVAVMPARKTQHSAGYDISGIVEEDTIVKPHETIFLHTGLKAIMLHDEYLMLVARSSVGMKKHLIIPQAVGVIDADFAQTGLDIQLAFTNISNEPVKLEKGLFRGAQGIFSSYMMTNDDIANERRTGGSGSTDENH